MALAVALFLTVYGVVATFYAVLSREDEWLFISAPALGIGVWLLALVTGVTS